MSSTGRARPKRHALARGRPLNIGRAFGVPDLEMLGLALEGASLVAGAAVGEGMRRLDEATVTALEGRAQTPISGAWACCFIVSACLSVYDFERAFAWSDRIAAFADRYGGRWMLASAEPSRRDRPLARPLATGRGAADRGLRPLPPGLDSRPLTGLAERLLRHAGPEGRLDRVGPLELRIRAQHKGALTPFRKVEGWLRELRQLAERAAAATREREAANRALDELGADRPPLPELTPREREVLTLLAEGLTNRQLAEQLVVSEHTVHRHVTNILRKLDAPSRAAAAALAARHGLI